MNWTINDIEDESIRESFKTWLYPPDIGFRCWTHDKNSSDREEFNIFMKLKRNKVNIKGNKFMYLTLQNFQLRHHDVEKMELFLKRIKYLYSEGCAVIESGSNKEIEKCNYHFHIFAKIKNNNTHKAKLKLEFLKLFHMDIGTKDYYKLQTWNECPSMPPYTQWCEEKLEYMEKGTSLKNSFPSILIPL